MTNEKPTKEIAVMNGEITLTVQATNEALMQKMLLELGDPEILIQPDALRRLNHNNRVETVHAANRYLDYCLGFGVVDDPPDDMNLQDIEFILPESVRGNLNNPFMRRAYWLRFVVNGFEGLPLSDQSLIVAEVTALTLGTDPHYNGKKPTKRTPRTAKRQR